MALHCTPAEARGRITAPEFAEWCAYDRIDPYGRERLDVVGGIVASTIANYTMGKAKTKPGDFMADWDGSKRARGAQSEDTMKANFNAFILAAKKLKERNGKN